MPYRAIVGLVVRDLVAHKMRPLPQDAPAVIKEHSSGSTRVDGRGWYNSAEEDEGGPHRLAAND